MTKKSRLFQKAVNAFTVFCLFLWSFGPISFTAHGAVSNTNIFPLVSGMDNMAPGGLKPLLALDATATGGEMLANVNLTVRGENGFQLASDLAAMTNGATTDGGFNLYRDNKTTGQVGMFDQADTRVTLSSVPAAGETRFSKITPSGTQLANGASALTAGDIILSKNQGANPPGYNWHLVTVNGANPGDAALRIDGNAVTFEANSRISKLTPAATALGDGNATAGGTVTVAAGDLVFARPAGAPDYRWLIATGAGTVLSDDAGENTAELNNLAEPTVTAATQFSKIVPAGTATDNGGTAGAGNQVAVALGDVVFVNLTGSGYGWHVVTTAGNLSSDATEQAGVRLDGGNAPQIVANSQMSKLSTAAGTFQVIVDDTTAATPTAVVAGDIAFSQVGSFPFSPTLSYSWYMATTGCDVACGGVAGSAFRLNDEMNRPGWAWKLFLAPADPPTTGTFPGADDQGKPDFFVVAKSSGTAANGVGFGVSIPQAADIVLTGGAFTVGMQFAPFVHIDSTPFSVNADGTFPPAAGPGNTSVPPDARPHVSFNKDPNPQTITSTTVLLQKNGTGANLCSNLQPFPGGLDCMPSSPLDFGASYTLTVTTGVTDMGGTALAANFTRTFTTGSGTSGGSGGGGIIQPPFVLDGQVQPPQGATYPSNAPMLIPFSQDMAVTGDGSVLSSSNIFLRDSAGNTTTGAITYASSTRMLKFTPSSNLSVGNSYILTIKNTVKSTAGLCLGLQPTGVCAPDYELRFSTVAMQTGALTVGTANPANNEANVVPNKSLALSFSSLLDATTVTSSSVRVKKATHVTGTSASNGDLFSGTLTLALGDIVFRKPASGNYGWALVTTANGAGTNPGLNGGAAAAVANSSGVTKITPSAVGTTTGANPAVSSVALNEGDVVLYSADGTGTNYRWGLITTASGAAAAYTVNGANVNGTTGGTTAGRVSKLVPQDFGAVTDGAKIVGPGELIFTSTTQNPNGTGYDWHVVTSTAPAAINSANVRLDGSSSAPVFATSAKFAKFAPAYHSPTTSSKHTLTGGDLVFGYSTASPASSGYGWHTVTTSGDKPGADGLRLDGMGAKPTYALNTLLANFTSVTGQPTAEGNMIRFTPQFLFTTNTQFTFTLQGGAQGIKDLVGNPLTADSTVLFTTSAVFTAVAPRLMGSRANTTSVTVDFSDQMKKDSSTNGAESIGNYTLESPIGTNVSLSGKTVTFDANSRTATITGLALTQGNSFKITVNANTQSAFTNTGVDTTNENQAGHPRFGQPRNEFSAKVESSTTLLQPGMGSQQGGGGFLPPAQMVQAALAQTMVFPKSPTAGATTTYEIEFRPTQVIPANGVIQLTFPGGTGVSAAAKVTGAGGDGSTFNDDINGPGTGTVVLSTAAETSGGANNDGVTIDTTNPDKPIVNVKLGAVATQTNDFLKFQIKGITNPTQSSNTNTSAGSPVTVKTYDTTGFTLETFTSNSIFVSPCGPRTISGRVLQSSGAGLNNARVGVFHFSGGQMVTTANNAAGGGLDGEYLITCLQASTGFNVNVDPSSLTVNEQPPAIDNVSTVSANVVKNIQLIAAPRTITINITGGPANKQVDVGGNGVEKTQGFLLKTVTLDGAGAGTATFGVANVTSWDFRVMPFIPKDPGLASAPPVFEFDQSGVTRVVVGTTNPAAATIALASFNRTLNGSIVDEAGVGIPNAFVVARKSGQAFGADLPSTTKSDGTFSIPVADGTYNVEAFVNGFQRLNPLSVSVSNTGQIPASTGVVFKVGKNANTLTLTGKVVDSSGNAIAEAGVWAEQITSENDETPIGYGLPPIMTEDDGSYTLFVSTGTWRVEAHAPNLGYLGKKLKTITTSSATLDNFTPSSLGSTVSGRVTLANTNVSGATVWLRSTTGPESYNIVTKSAADPDINYTISVPSGTYDIGVSIPKTDTGGGEITSQAVSIQGNVTQNFNMIAGNEITVNLTTAQAAQITDAFVTVFDVQNNPVASTDVKTNDNTGANGIYKLTPPAGTYTVRVASKSRGFIGEQTGINTTGGAQTTTITESAKQTITGTIRSGGAGVEGAHVRLSGTTTDGKDANFDGTTGPDGTYTIVAPAGNYRLNSAKGKYMDSAAATPVTIAAANIANQDRTLNLTTTTGKVLSGTITRSDSKKFDGGFVSARNTTTGATVLGDVKSDGTYSMSADAGTWQLKGFLDGFETSDSAVVIAGSDVTQNLSATPKTGFTKQVSRAGSFKRNVGGIFTDKSVGPNFKLSLPPNAGGNSADSNITLSTKLTSAAPTTATAQPMGGQAITISASTSSGPVTSLTSSATVSIPYDPTTLTGGKTENDIYVGYLDTTKGEWVKEQGCTQDQTKDLFTCSINHFSDFAPLVASSSLPAPTNFTATAASTTSTSLSWTAVSGATGYNVYRSGTSTGTYARLGSEPTVSSGSTTTYSDSGLNSGATYFYKLSAKDASGESASTTAVSVTTLTATAAAAAAVSGSSGGSSGGATMLTTTNTSTTSSTSTSSPTSTPAPSPTPVSGSTGSSTAAKTTPTSSPAPTASQSTQSASGQEVIVSETPKLSPVVVKKLVQVKTALKTGAKGAQVTSLQEVLKAEGLLKKVTGKMDKATVNAVMKFQEMNDIVQKGEKGYGTLGADTRSFINSRIAEHKEAATKAAEVAAKAESQTTVSLEGLKPLPKTGTVKIGAKNAQVTTLQAVLKAEGLLKKSSGKMDTATLNALKKFQVKYGIAKKGKTGYGNLGPATRAKINTMLTVE